MGSTLWKYWEGVKFLTLKSHNSTADSIYFDQKVIYSPIFINYSLFWANISNSDKCSVCLLIESIWSCFTVEPQWPWWVVPFGNIERGSTFGQQNLSPALQIQDIGVQKWDIFKYFNILSKSFISQIFTALRKVVQLSSVCSIKIAQDEWLWWVPFGKY